MKLMARYFPYTNNAYMARLHTELMDYVAMVGGVTARERKALIKWVADGNSPDFDNPYLLYDKNGCLMDFITAFRIKEDRRGDPGECSWGSESESAASDDGFLF